MVPCTLDGMLQGVKRGVEDGNARVSDDSNAPAVGLVDGLLLGAHCGSLDGEALGLPILWR